MTDAAAAPPHASAPASAEAVRLRMRAAVKASGTSFYWAMRLLPKPRRAAMFAIYAFCREADDIADDEGLNERERRAGLKAWRDEITQLFASRPQTDIGRALLGPVQDYGLPKDAFLAVIDGCEMDAGNPVRAPDWPTLKIYCARVAGAVGRLSVRAFGEIGEAGERLAESQGLALQLTNILRDMAEDAGRGRLYLPREALAEAGIESDDPETVMRDPRLAKACAAVAREAENAYRAAEAAMAECDPRAIRPARIMLEVYRAKLARAHAGGFPLDGEPKGLARTWVKLRQLIIALRYAGG